MQNFGGNNRFFVKKIRNNRFFSKKIIQFAYAPQGATVNSEGWFFLCMHLIQKTFFPPFLREQNNCCTFVERQRCRH